MHSFQTYIKSVREKKGLEIHTAIDATNLSEDTILKIEQANDYKLLEESAPILKNQVRRYCEYLEIPERKIVSILNKLDILYYKKAKFGKMKPFDYLNRIAIFIISLSLIGLIINTVQEKVFDRSTHTETPKNSSSIIFTPIQYDSFDENKDNAPSKVKAHPPANADMSTIVIAPEENTQEELASVSNDSNELDDTQSTKDNTQKELPSTSDDNHELDGTQSTKDNIEKVIEDNQNITEPALDTTNSTITPDTTTSEPTPDTNNSLEQNKTLTSNNTPAEDISKKKLITSTYIVKSGDSLYNIANRISDDITGDKYSNYNLILAIKGYNIDQNPSIINGSVQVGETLNIPLTDVEINNSINTYNQYRKQQKETLNIVPKNNKRDSGFLSFF